jgi:hypothetical protein
MKLKVKRPCNCRNVKGASPSCADEKVACDWIIACFILILKYILRITRKVGRRLRNSENKILERIPVFLPERGDVRGKWQHFGGSRYRWEERVNGSRETKFWTLRLPLLLAHVMTFLTVLSPFPHLLQILSTTNPTSSSSTESEWTDE